MLLGRRRLSCIDPGVKALVAMAESVQMHSQNVDKRRHVFPVAVVTRSDLTSLQEILHPLVSLWVRPKGGTYRRGTPLAPIPVHLLVLRAVGALVSIHFVVSGAIISSLDLDGAAASLSYILYCLVQLCLPLRHLVCHRLENAPPLVNVRRRYKDELGFGAHDHLRVGPFGENHLECLQARLGVLLDHIRVHAQNVRPVLYQTFKML
mmetsp:Transcript_2259/g.7110  ORF Transcript_2259/g.7110 Transcript_2259/m.7110 type:complete len:207 (-) Transcript_2259:1061-1681(-)